jgi:hypothetical protein
MTMEDVKATLEAMLIKWKPGLEHCMNDEEGIAEGAYYSGNEDDAMQSGYMAGEYDTLQNVYEKLAKPLGITKEPTP